MILINKGSDVEFYSSTSKGAVQGYGYVFHKTNTYGPRILRLVGTSDFSVHDIALVDCKPPSPYIPYVSDKVS
jgi:rhamnogalacturonan hydrolase